MFSHPNRCFPFPVLVPAGLVLLSALLVSAPALAQPAPAPSASAPVPREIATLEQALSDAWEKAPLTIRKAVFVAERPSGYGMQTERPNAVFRPGEVMLVYAEPIAYGFQALDGGTFGFEWHIDLAIKSPAGRTLMSRKDFGKLPFRSHLKNRETMLTLTVTLDDAPAGDFILDCTLRDTVSGKSAAFSLPFTIQE